MIYDLIDHSRKIGLWYFFSSFFLEPFSSNRLWNILFFSHSFDILCWESVHMFSVTFYLFKNSDAIISNSGILCNRAIADPTLQRRPSAAGELYIPQESWPFSSYFFTLFPFIDISFYYFYRFSRHTRTYSKNPRVKH